MSAIKLATPSSGSISLSPENTASNLTITVPALTATMAINGPAFSAYQSSAQTLSSATDTKIQFQTEEWDTANAFDNTTNFRFTPQVAGYYQVNASIRANNAFTSGTIFVYKNGISFKQGMYIQTNGAQFIVSALVYCNGSTDYIEIYGNLATGQPLTNNSTGTYFQASLVRAA